MSGPGAPGMQTKSKENKDEEEIQQALKQLKLLHIKVCMDWLMTS